MLGYFRRKSSGRGKELKETLGRDPYFWCSAWKNTAAKAIAKAAVLEQSARPRTAVCYEDI